MIMPRPLMIAVTLALAPLPAFASIAMSSGSSSLPVTSFNVPFFNLNDNPLPVGSAAASALFIGQGWGVTGPVDGDYWEYAVGAPSAGNLQLMGQYNPTSPPPPSPTVDPGKYQNVVSFTPTGLAPRLGGMLDNAYTGVTSFLFADNINTFSMVALDAGVTSGDGLGGPVTFSFYARNGGLLQSINWAKAVDGAIVFRSSAVDIAGIQIQHQDPRGLAFQTLQFGVEVPVPVPAALLLPGLAALGLMRRSRAGRPRQRGGFLTAS